MRRDEETVDRSYPLDVSNRDDWLLRRRHYTILASGEGRDRANRQLHRKTDRIYIYIYTRWIDIQIRSKIDRKIKKIERQMNKDV